MKKICFRADASAQIGYGHFIRTLALADMLKDDFDCVFYTAEPSSYQIREMQKVCSYVPLIEKTKFEDFIAMLDGSEIVVLDNYFYTTDYQKEVRAKGCKLVCIDDMHDRHYVADLVINHALTEKELFDVELYTKLCLGFNYALLRAPFLKPLPDTRRKNQMVINFGGADPFKMTDHVVSLLLQMKLSYDIVVILGETVYLSEDNRKHVTIRKNQTAEQMAELFETSAFGMLSASTVCIEALSRKLPMIIGYHVDNQEEIYRVLMESKSATGIGNWNEITEGLLTDALTNIQDNNESFDFIGIRQRYIDVFNSL